MVRRKAYVLEPYFNHMVVHYMLGYYIVNYIINVEWHAMLTSSSTYFGALLGWICADIVSYFIHLFIDSKLYNRLITKNNKPIDTIVDTHHATPTNYSWLTDAELVSITYPPLMPVLLYMIWLEYSMTYPTVVLHPMYVGFKVSLITFTLLAGYIHKWVHERQARMRLPWLVCKLQDARVILHPLDHRIHHQTFDCQFSLVNGISQFFFDPFLSNSGVVKECKCC